jgi:hypothetical protein
VHFHASFASASGVRLGEGRLSLERCRFEGPFRRALEAGPGARVSGREVDIAGAPTGIHAQGAEVELSDLQVDGARMAGVFASGGRVRLREPVLTRCFYGVQATQGAQVSLTGAILAQSGWAGVAGTGATVEVRDLVCLGPAQDAALTLDGGRIDLRQALLFQPGPLGVRARIAQGRLAQLTALEAREEDHALGNAVLLLGGELRLDDLDAERCQGPAVEAQTGHSQVRGLTVAGGPAAVALEHEAHLDVYGLLQRGSTGTGVACIEQGAGAFLAPRFEQMPQGAWLVDCSCRLRVSPARDAPLPCGKDGAAAGVAPPAQRTIPPRRP